MDTGYAEEDARERFAGKGLAVFLQTPYTVPTLIQKLSGVLKV
jgi:hypothetical protein